MVLAGIIALIVLGIILLFIEFFVVPGVSVFGIAGIIVLILGIYFSYSSFGVNIGNTILFGTIAAMGLSFYIAYRKGVWNKMALSTQVTSKVNDAVKNVTIGDKGITISRLAPMGTVMVNGSYFEASSKGTFINENSEIEIINIDNNRITVKPIKL